MAEAVRMTKGLAEDIARAAVAKTFKDRFGKLDERLREVAIMGYKSIMTRDLTKKIEALPNELKYTSNKIELRISGRWVSWRPQQTDKVQNFLFPVGWDRLYHVKDDTVIKAWDSYEKDLETTKREHDAAQRKLTVLLQSCSNFNKVAELWPEGKEFYKDYTVPRTKGGLPAICFDDVNKVLGLTKKGEKK